MFFFLVNFKVRKFFESQDIEAENSQYSGKILNILKILCNCISYDGIVVTFINWLSSECINLK